MKIENIFGYKIDWAHAINYKIVINSQLMTIIERSNEIVASSRIYFVCKIKKNGFLSRFLTSSTERPEILYVGETFNKAKRFNCHKHILEATTLTNRHDQIVVYFIRTRFLHLTSLWEKNPFDLMNELKELNSKASVRLLERLYIHLFQPVLNRNHKDKNIFRDNLLRQKLINNGVRYVHLDIGMEDTNFQFWSLKRKVRSDCYYLDLKTETMHEGIPEPTS